MYTLYIDYFSHVMLSNRVNQKFNGGDNATKILLLKMMQTDYYKNFDQYLILHKGFEPSDEYENSIINGKYFKKIYVDKIDDIKFKNNAVLFVPVVCGREMMMVDRIKRINPTLKVYGRIHDKNHNFPFDFHDRYYFSGIARTGLNALFDFVGKRILFYFKYKHWIKNFDKIFSVSNYSMQRLQSDNIKFINYYYCDTLDYLKNSSKNWLPKEDFILVVSGGRPEKNALRTIEAFIEYKYRNKIDKVKLYVTGINKETQNNLLRFLKTKQHFNEKYVKFFDYVSNDVMLEMMSTCSFLMFTSKGEGFGLPILEAAFCGRPILASSTTAIPEVLGSSIRYVDPFSIESMVKGIEYYRDMKNLTYYENKINKRVQIVRLQIQEDYNSLIREIYEE